MQRFLLVVSILALVACDEEEPDTSALMARIAALETKIEALETRLAAAETVGTDNATALEDASGTLAGAAELLTLVLVEEGDVVVEGANLRVRWNDVPGKGNVIIGEDSPRGECVGGVAAGSVCSVDGITGGYQCTDGTCEVVAVVEKTGEHNLVIGEGHQYSGRGSIVAGRYSTVTGGAAAVLSGWNNSAGGGTAIVGGEDNTTTVEEDFATILGGKNQSTASDYETIPPIN